MAEEPGTGSALTIGVKAGGSPGEEDDRFSFTTAESGNTFHEDRRYQTYRSGRYPLPNDEEEQTREQDQHEIMCNILGDMFNAPVDNPRRILDIGTGTGTSEAMIVLRHS